MSDDTFLPPCQLYLITPPAIPDLEAFGKDLEAALSAGPVACVQLRLKDVDDATILDAAAHLMPICHDHEVAFLINDRADLALAADADGVHLGQGDGTVESARKMLGMDREIGVTCHDSMHLAYEAGDAGANYVAFGAFFDTDTKQTEHRADLELLTTWDEVTEIPCVAIGGIKPEHAKTLSDAGAHFIAVCSGVWGHPKGPAAAVKEYVAALEG
ncbi:thiamine phosphate synthase [Gimibacter soli]|uniref:Thiamine-phosphate synthase n=1 Tax=Gimibacter soli TaxID=3024400 RepID=A0AAE9XS21_9PROT|nr:thiamine phosphate synthase [Gimibacter soli]WCL53935.1 thiamine phosphate synthase [Gimibacter soli]